MRVSVLVPVKCRGYSRAELLQLVSTLALRQLDTLVQLLLQPRKVSHESCAVSDMARAETLDLRSVLDSFEVRDRRARDVDVGKSDCFGNRHARFVADQHFLSSLMQSVESIRIEQAKREKKNVPGVRSLVP